MDNDDHTPISKIDFLHGVKVVDIGDLRIQRGRTMRLFEPCKHLHLTYCDNERRIFCEDCKKTISGFDGFKSLVEFFDGQMKLIRKPS